jgi:hypothetical protein
MCNVSTAVGELIAQRKCELLADMCRQKYADTGSTLAPSVLVGAEMAAWVAAAQEIAAANGVTHE